ncbi:MAG: radical SAM protein [Tannerellaceae bacterium]|jgi:MoaA/NifB/PqqE/SkfB family radical SAM enzyme|nr:radical SAM protein [Tannerellaceae bacterium]
MLKKNILKLIRIISDFFQAELNYRTKPRVLQLPITSKCNSRCVTCNVWKNKTPIDIEPDKLKDILGDPYFNEVTTVGINGGEPTLHLRFEDVVNAVLSLPKIKNIHLISNAILTKRLLSLMKSCKQLCSASGCVFNYTISIDGISQTHNTVRGVSTAFNKTIESLEEIMKDKNSYCDNIDIGCTISKYNVYNLVEFETYFSNYEININYHLAVPNKRIGTFYNADYSVLSDKRAKLMAEEFFLVKYKEANQIKNKIKYFMNFYYLNKGGKGRLATCHYLHQDITIDEKLDVFLCATASDKIGNLTVNTFNSLIKSGKVNEIEKNISELCDTCIHYCDFPSLKGLFIMFKYFIANRIRYMFLIKNLSKWLE